MSCAVLLFARVLRVILDCDGEDDHPAVWWCHGLQCSQDAPLMMPRGIEHPDSNPPTRPRQKKQTWRVFTFVAVIIYFRSNASAARGVREARERSRINDATAAGQNAAIVQWTTLPATTPARRAEEPESRKSCDGNRTKKMNMNKFRLINTFLQRRNAVFCLLVPQTHPDRARLFTMR